MISFLDINHENFSRFRNDLLEIEKLSFPSPWNLRSFLEEVANPVSRLTAALNSERLSGYACFWLYAGELHLMNIAIRPEERCRGLGGMLLERVLETGRNWGASFAWLEVRPSNLMARMLYARAGFKRSGLRKNYYRDTREDAIIMSLDLSRGVSEKRLDDKGCILQLT